MANDAYGGNVGDHGGCEKGRNAEGQGGLGQAGRKRECFLCGGPHRARDCPTRPKLLALIQEYDGVPEPSCQGEATIEAMRVRGSEGREELAVNNSNQGRGRGQGEDLHATKAERGESLEGAEGKVPEPNMDAVMSITGQAKATDSQGELEGLTGEVLGGHRKGQTPTGLVELESETSTMGQAEVTDYQGQCEGLVGKVPGGHRERQTPTGRVQLKSEGPSAGALSKTPRLGAPKEQMGVGITQPRDLVWEALRKTCLMGRDKKEPRDTAQQSAKVWHYHLGKGPKRGGKLWRRKRKPRDFGSGPRRRGRRRNRWGRMSRPKPRGHAEVPMRCADGSDERAKTRERSEDGPKAHAGGPRAHACELVTRRGLRPGGRAECGTSTRAKVRTCGTTRGTCGPSGLVRNHTWTDSWDGRPRYVRRRPSVVQLAGRFRKGLEKARPCGEGPGRFQKGLEKARHFGERPRRLQKDQESSSLGGEWPREFLEHSRKERVLERVLEP